MLQVSREIQFRYNLINRTIALFCDAGLSVMASPDAHALIVTVSVWNPAKLFLRVEARIRVVEDAETEAGLWALVREVGQRVAGTIEW